MTKSIFYLLIYAAYTDTYMYAHIYMCIHIHTCTCLYIDIHNMHIHTWEHTCPHICIHTYIHTPIQIHIHAHMHSHTCIYTYTQTYSHPRYLTIVNNHYFYFLVDNTEIIELQNTFKFRLHLNRCFNRS